MPARRIVAQHHLRLGGRVLAAAEDGVAVGSDDAVAVALLIDKVVAGAGRLGATDRRAGGRGENRYFLFQLYRFSAACLSCRRQRRIRPERHLLIYRVIRTAPPPGRRRRAEGQSLSARADERRTSPAASPTPAR